MSNRGIDPALLHAWLAARSVARGLPAPVAEYGGFRVDTHSEAEAVRWVFPTMGPGLEELARAIREPRFFLKLCGTAEALQAALPAGWAVHAPSYFMQATGMPATRPLAERYRLQTERVGAVSQVRIVSKDGALAASGFAAETNEAFVYDRIVTDPAHRRKGLGQAVMSALRATKNWADAPELLVATEDGRALYTTLGWSVISPYCEASIVEPTSLLPADGTDPHSAAIS